jgi:hypothetical protein
LRFLSEIVSLQQQAAHVHRSFAREVVLKALRGYGRLDDGDTTVLSGSLNHLKFSFMIFRRRSYDDTALVFGLVENFGSVLTDSTQVRAFGIVTVKRSLLSHAG